MEGGLQRQRTKIVVWRYEYSKKWCGAELDEWAILCLEVYIPQGDRGKARENG